MFRSLLSLFPLLSACASGPGPTASAGAEVVGEPGQTFLLDGSASAAEGATYTWSVLEGPEEAPLIDADEPVAYLLPETEGVYTLGLEVCDAAGRCEAATTRALVGAKARQSAFGGASFGGGSFKGAGGFGKNQAPQAQASASRALGAFSALIRLDGSASTDPDGDTLRVSDAGGVNGGSIVINADNTITFTPNPGFVGLGTFGYSVVDEFGGYAEALVQVTVEPVGNRAPVAVDDYAETINLAWVLIDALANDSDPDGDAISVLSFTQPANGTVVQVAPGRFHYKANAAFCGLDPFTYTIRDSAGNIATATVTVNVLD